MSEHKPIFLDRVKASVAQEILGTHFGPIGPNQAGTADGKSMREIITRLVPFVIDDDAVQKAMEVRTEFITNPRIPLIDIACVPFAETWIEYDPRAKQPAGTDTTLASEHYGHMVIRGDTGVSVMTFEAWGKKIITHPFIMNWSLEPGTTTPFRHVIGKDYRKRLTDETADYVRTRLLTGNEWLPTWKDRVGGDLVQPIAHGAVEVAHMSREWQIILRENRSCLSLLMSILALIAWCPVELTEKKPKGMFLHERKPRPYMDHKIVHLRIPIRTAYSYIRKGAAEVIHRRRHRVREHIRVYNAGTPRERRVVIHEHMRGDAALGYVTQEYEVST